MPTPLISKLHKQCGIPIDTLEKKWAYAKHRSKGPDGKPQWGIATNNFKRSLPSKCLKKAKLSVSEQFVRG